MIEAILNACRKAVEGIRPWVIVAPWEQGLRVRLGKHVKLLPPGVHIKIPIADFVFVQGIRVRAVELGRQQASKSDNRTCISFGGSVEYCLTDIELLYRTMQSPADNIRLAGRAALFRAVRDGDESSIEEGAAAALRSEMEGRGVDIVRFRLAEFSIVKTFRLIGDYNQSYTTGKDLCVDDK